MSPSLGGFFLFGACLGQRFPSAARSPLDVKGTQQPVSEGNASVDAVIFDNCVEKNP
jgi:hypothetical protein